MWEEVEVCKRDIFFVVLTFTDVIEAFTFLFLTDLCDGVGVVVMVKV